MVLFESLAVTGHRKTDGSANSSGRAWFYKPGTVNVASIFADAAGAPLSNPVTLSAGGKATVYFSGQVDAFFEDFLGNPVETLALAERAERVEIQNAGYTGVLPSGSQGAGGITDLNTVLTRLASNVGGLDGQYLESVGATSRTPGDKFRETSVSVKDFGAVGDGIHDDTTNIQAAFNEVLRLGGGVLFVPPGTYNISAAIVAVNVQGIRILGAGQRASKIVQTNATANGFTLGSASPTSNDIVFEEVQVTATASSGIGIQLNNVTRPILDTITVSGFATEVSFELACTNPLITNNCVMGVGIGGTAAVVAKTNTSNLQITNSRLSSNSAAPALILNSVSGVTLTGVTFSALTPITAASVTNGLSVIGCIGLSTVTNPFTLTVNDPPLTQVGNGVEGYTEDVLAGNSVTPDWTRGYSIRYRASTSGTYTINAPNSVAPTRKGVVMKLELYNAAGGPVTGWTFNAIYHRSATAVSLLDTHHTTVTFEYDIVLAVWREIGISDTT